VKHLRNIFCIDLQENGTEDYAELVPITEKDAEGKPGGDGDNWKCSSDKIEIEDPFVE
jgi:hypothetical protein